MPKDELDLDLDLSELGTSRNVIASSSEPRPKSKAQRDKEEFEAICLFIPSTERQHVFISKTIKECSGAEFIRWADGVCFSLDRDKDYYDNKQNRSEEFRNIIKYHHYVFIRTNPNATKVLH